MRDFVCASYTFSFHAQKLVKDCKAILAASPVLSDETTEDQPASNAEKDSKYVRARALLDSLEVLQKSEPTT